MKMLTMLLMFVCVSCNAVKAEVPASNGVVSEAELRPMVCSCSPGYDEIGCPSGDVDADCVCTDDDNCPGVPNCEQQNVDSDDFGDICDELPNTADPEAALVALDARLDALEGAGTAAALINLQYDIAALDAALAEIRTKYPGHYHGLLGLAGDPVGSSGDLSYSLPSDP